MIAPNPDKPHEPTVACGTNHCYIHHVDEPDGVMGCGECFHSYATWADLLRAWLDNHPDLTRDTELPKTPESIWFCPVCGHDF